MNNIFELLFIKGEKYPSVLSEDQSYSPCVNMFKNASLPSDDFKGQTAESVLGHSILGCCCNMVNYVEKKIL